MHLPTPDWLHHRLTVYGPAVELATFRRSVAGPGVIPWDIDYQRFEEDWFYRLLADQRRHGDRHQVSTVYARRLAEAFRETLWLQHEAELPPPRAIDLNAILPVPSEVLRLGWEHDDAAAWLWHHWGTTWPLRHVRQRVPTLVHASDIPSDAWVCEFFAADWTPWPAFRLLRQRFTTLTFRVSIAY